MPSIPMDWTSVRMTSTSCSPSTPKHGRREAALIFEHLRTFGDHLPNPLWDQYTDLLDRLG